MSLLNSAQEMETKISFIRGHLDLPRLLLVHLHQGLGLTSMFRQIKISGFKVLTHRKGEVSGSHHIPLVLFMKRITQASVITKKVYTMGMVSGFIFKRIIHQQRKLMEEIEPNLLLQFLQEVRALLRGPVEFRIVYMLWEIARI